MHMNTTGGAVTFGANRELPVRGLRSGIIGAGFIGEIHARAVRAAGGRLVAVSDASPEGIDAVAARMGADWAAPSAEALIESPDVDVVHICTPNFLHADLARAALAAGKHVICEKPLATTLQDSTELAGLARSGGGVTAVPFIYRYYPSVREARGRLAEGLVGPVHLIHGSYLQDWLSRASDQNWRTDPKLGGASRTFADIGVHWCDLIEFVTGHRITALSARLITTVPERTGGGHSTVVTTEDAATLMFETDQGAIGSLVVSQVTPGRKNRLWVSFDALDASLTFDQESPEALWVGSRDGVQLVQRGVANLVDAQRLSVLPPGHPQGYQDCFNALVRDVYAAASGDSAAGLPTFDDGARAAVITAAVLESAATQVWVTVGE
jgi:predicted dehydrogenase